MIVKGKGVEWALGNMSLCVALPHSIEPKLIRLIPICFACHVEVCKGKSFTLVHMPKFLQLHNVV